MNEDKIEREVLSLAQSMVLFGVSLDDTIKYLRRVYAEELEETARRARDTPN